MLRAELRIVIILENVYMKGKPLMTFAPTFLYENRTNEDSRPFENEPTADRESDFLL